MNRTRVAALLRELADEFEGAPSSEPIEIESSTNVQPKRRAAKPRLVRPEGESDDLARAKARRFLKDNGFTKVTR